MKITWTLALLAALFAVPAVHAQTGNWMQFNSLEELHGYNTTSPILAAGYIQGVLDMEGIEAAVANPDAENAWHTCLKTRPAIANAPALAQLVEDYYAANPADRPNSAALAIILSVSRFCGIASAHLPADNTPSDNVPLNKMKPDSKPAPAPASIPGGKRA